MCMGGVAVQRECREGQGHSGGLFSHQDDITMRSGRGGENSSPRRDPGLWELCLSTLRDLKCICSHTDPSIVCIYILISIYLNGRLRARARSSVYQITLQKPTTARMMQAEARGLELHPGLLPGWQVGPLTSCLLPLAGSWAGSSVLRTRIRTCGVSIPREAQEQTGGMDGGIRAHHGCCGCPAGIAWELGC